MERVQRCTRTMVATVAGTHLSGVPPPLSQRHGFTTACQAVALPTLSSAARGPPPRLTAATTLMSPRQPTGSLLFAPTEAPAPRRLASFSHHKAICLDLADPHAYPHIPEPSDAHPFEPHTLYGKYVVPPATGKIQLRHLVAEFRSFEAAKCGCGVSDVAWFYQAPHVTISGANAWGQSSSKNNEMLSLSTTFSSGPCMASFTLLYLNYCIENSLVMRALEEFEDVTPGAAHLIELRFSDHVLCSLPLESHM